MNMNGFIINALSSVGVPVELLKYTGTSASYIVFQEYLGQGEAFSEDEEDITGHYLLINLFTKGDNTILITNIKTLMKNAGFKKQDDHDQWEDETKLFNHIFHFYYEESLD